ncbi:hypothetical protein EKO04_007867 [Ascochyta lentis]|uniref:Uncharacterized protein n=1 Tax=Ascochyta lentis TaxID=205686 RepID=A0A8H7MGD6_9PLEO|nr:hypothetical protein EKO04_007867 [Ascochyta lentis]
MPWWRGDPSLWARSPAHRYAQRILRDHEAALRTRYFSRTPSNAAQHQDQNDTRRPEGMTDLEWMQLQHYRKWRKRLQEHPYKALFGASEDMLRGKGLTDWEWVYKTFPKWMLREMDPEELADHGKNADKNDRGYRYGIRLDENAAAKEQPLADREPTFAQPAIKTTHYERDEFGIVSPSDLRRPKEGPHVEVVSKHQGQSASENNDVASHRLSSSTPDSELPDPEMKPHDAVSSEPFETPDQPKHAAIKAKEASNRESSFIDAFFAEDLKANSGSWRQTALQRRSASDVIARPRVKSFSVARAEGPVMETTPVPARETIMIPSSQALVDNYPYPKNSTSATAGQSAEKKAHRSQKKVGWSVPELNTDIQKAETSKAGSTAGRSTSSILETLPKDDIDFLSADDIRAAMGTRKSGKRDIEEKKQDRQTLEAGYATAKPKALDEVVEAHVLNNHYVRRTHQELERERIGSQTPAAEGVEAKLDAPQPPPESIHTESSIDRMRRWIEEGGVSLSKHFWQDPIEASAPSEADMQFAKQMAGLGKGRRAREHISGDLETDLPMCKGLMERLKNDENRVEHAVHFLRSPSKVIPGVEISRNLRTIRERRLRNTYERTEKQFESACEALRDLNTEAVQKATNAFKRRLGIASRVLHKNHTLTRMLTWSAQARLDEPNLERSKVELYSEILTRLATLRDTQLALARLMDHAVQTYGVSFKPADEALSRPVPLSESSVIEATNEADSVSSEKPTANSLTNTVAERHLVNEIQSQKAAMQGLSDDGYARAPRQVTRKPFEEKSLLAHSLFRPFNLQLESLGGKTEGEEATDKLKEAFKQKMGDKKLVQEVRSAYEDVYGPITIEHRQVPQNGESANAEARDIKAFEMLKDDPVDQAATNIFEEAESPETKTSSKPLVTDVIAEEVATSPGATISSSSREAEASEPSITAPAAEKGAAAEELQTSLSTDGASSSSPTHTETTSHDTIINLPTHYTILIHDPQTDTMSITTSTSGPPRDTTPALPVHQALSSLKAPAKFIPYLTSGLEAVTAKRHMLVMRDALDSNSSTRGFETVSASSFADQPTEAFNSDVNPIDGTTRLSPTGYSGVEQSQEQLERDFEERRQAATDAARSRKSRQQARDENVPKKKRGGVGSVVKTAIWASAVCYIVGVSAEVLR